MKIDVFFVDDEESIRRAALRHLTTEGVSLTALADGESTLAAMGTRPPGLIFLDFRLPDRDGLELLAEIHARRPQIPVVVISGAINSHQAMAAVRCGAVDYILKPLDWAQLRGIIRLHAAAHPLDAGLSRA